MIDLTEKFFNEIITSRKYTIDSFRRNPLENKKFYGRCAVVSKRGKEKARELKKFISDQGFSPVVLEFEEAMRLKGNVDKKLQNLDILILHAADTPKHLFAGKERIKHEKFLGDKGILVHTKYSNKALMPRIVLRVLFNYILSSDEFEYLLEEKKTNSLSKDLIFSPQDIIHKTEYLDLLQKFNINPDDVHIIASKEFKKNFHTDSVGGLRVISLKEFQQSVFGNSQQDLHTEDAIIFTIKSNQKYLLRGIFELEQAINNIYKDYDADHFYSKVQVYSDL